MPRADGNLKKPKESAKRKCRWTIACNKIIELSGNDEWNYISNISCVADADEAYEDWVRNSDENSSGSCFYDYHGESNDDYHTHVRHGRGTCIWASGARYEGQWREGKCLGLGAMTYPDGTLYEGLWEQYGWKGRGTLWMSDGNRCFEGLWVKCGFALSGAMMEANGDVFYMEFNRKLLFNDSTWASAKEMEPSPASRRRAWPGSGPRMYSRRGFYRSEVLDKHFSAGPAVTTKQTLAGRVVEGGPPAPGGRERAVRVELAGGGSYIGAMRGLAFCGDGLLTDAGGAVWRVKHADGGMTFAEGQEPDSKEVPPERTPLSFIPSHPAYTHVLKL